MAKGLERSWAAVGQCLGRQDASDVRLERNGHDSVGSVPLRGADTKVDQRDVAVDVEWRGRNEEQDQVAVILHQLMVVPRRVSSLPAPGMAPCFPKSGEGSRATDGRRPVA